MHIFWIGGWGAGRASLRDVVASPAVGVKGTSWIRERDGLDAL
ncbi:hypothetical protein [Burkholderia ubonensis]|nr:hypothetical protein [Burkholderia ubonensis]